MRQTGVAFFLLLLLNLPWTSLAGKPYPKNYFRSPVDLRILLAGSFGELRKNHFHSGIDIRTESVEGKPVYAVADGYVSRINISPSGFGKALYITHPNGYVSVYGHLKGFNSTIGSWVRSRQYKNESFAMDTPLDSGVLPVKKGELIAYAGNSGASAGPHLHFEMRDAASQDAINPALFGFVIKDEIPPTILKARVYPREENSMVNFANKPVNIAVAGAKGNYAAKIKDTVRVSGNIIFGIDAYDMINDNSMKNGLYSIDLYVDTTLILSQVMDHFAFADTRAINSVIDYPLFVNTKSRIQRSYIAPNNRLGIYPRNTNRGVVNFTGNKKHKVTYVVKDVSGNTSKLTFWVKSHPPASIKPKKQPQAGTMLSCKNANLFEKPGVKLNLPEGALYEDVDFLYTLTPAPARSYSSLHHLHNIYTPLNTYCTLSLKPDKLPVRLHPKAVIVYEDSPGHFISRGGSWESGYLRTQVRDLGNYTVMVDTIPPAIKPLNVTSNKNVSRQNSIRVKISDNLSGIKSYRGTIDGKWILMDYDQKYAVLTYVFDDRIKRGKNVFRLVVTDETGNESTYSATLMR